MQKLWRKQFNQGFRVRSVDLIEREGNAMLSVGVYGAHYGMVLLPHEVDELIKALLQFRSLPL